MRSETIRLYEDRPFVTLTSYLLGPDTALKMARPAVIICPGGGYFTCSDTEAEPVALMFNSWGYNAFVLRYSVYFEGQHPSKMANMPAVLEPKPELVFPRATLDVADAVALVKRNAGEWGVDAARVLLCGFSAGAHNVAMYATRWNTPLVRDAVDATEDELRPAGVVLGYGMLDMVMHDAWRKTVSGGARAFMDDANVALFGEKDPTAELLADASPALHVGPDTPPVFLWNTAADELVPPRHTLHMAAALSEVGVPFELHTFQNGAHGLSLADQASARKADQLVPEVAQWQELCRVWMMRNYPLPIPGAFDGAAFM